MSNSRKKQRPFDTSAYWATRPYCIVCSNRKTRQGSICHECLKAGHTEASLGSNAVNSQPKEVLPEPSKPKLSFAASIVLLLSFAGAAWWAVANTNVPKRYQPTELQRRAEENGDVYVRGYHRGDGTYVRPHVRSQQNYLYSDNYNSSGNRNPYTNKAGRRSPARDAFYFDVEK